MTARIHRRRLLGLALGAGALPALSRIAAGETYPSRPVLLVDMTAAGGSPDIIARLMAAWLSARLGQPFVVENRTGASGNIGTEFVVKSAPDGYTLLLAMSGNAINASLFKKLNFDFIRDTAPVASLATIPLVLEVNPSLPITSVPEFIAYARAHPGQINVASGGIGSPHHVAAVLFAMMTGISVTHLPYRGEALALPDVMSGQVQAIFGVMPASLGYIKAGKLRALAITASARQPQLPDIPTIAEFLPGYEANGWYGIVAPRGTPADVVTRLNRTINDGLADPALKAHLTDLGCAIFSSSPADFGKFIADETGKWAKVIKFAGVQVD